MPVKTLTISVQHGSRPNGFQRINIFDYDYCWMLWYCCVHEYSDDTVSYNIIVLLVVLLYSHKLGCQTDRPCSPMVYCCRSVPSNYSFAMNPGIIFPSTINKESLAAVI